MYLIEIELVPTSALTFRILPGSVVDIGTYPFVPPTAFSGFLRRAAMLSKGITSFLEDQDSTKPDYYILPRHLVSLGAYGRGSVELHRTHRKGPRDFGHNAFSRLYWQKPDKKPAHDENIQLHTWEYWLTGDLCGFVVSEDVNELVQLKSLEGEHGVGGFGCKLGKEGFAFIKRVSEPVQLSRKHVNAHPATIMWADDLLKTNPYIPADIYNLYRFDWPQNELLQWPSAFEETKSEVNGYIPFVAATIHKDHTVQIDYYVSAAGIHIPVSLVDILR